MILQTIKKYDSIVVFGHVNPDGDSFGSQIAVKLAIEKNFPGKKVYVAGTGMRNMYPLFGKPDEIDDETIANSLGIILDFNALYRSEDQRVGQTKEIVMIDHHEPYPDLKRLFPKSIIKSKYAANCTILYGLFNKWHFEIDQQIRNALFYGISTDTNRFMYLEDDKKSFEVAYELVKAGVDLTEIYHNNSKVSKRTLSAKGYVLTHYQFYSDKVVYSVLPRKFLNEINFTGYPGFLVNQMANVENCEGWVLFIENEDGTMSVELRSASINIRPVSVMFGGGGHEKACGVQSCEYSQEMIDAVLKETQKIIMEGQKHVGK